MTLEIIEFVAVTPDFNAKSSFKIGSLQVKVGALFKVWLDVNKGKTPGSFYFRIPNTKCGEKWLPSYEFTDKKEFAKFAQDELGNEFKARFM